MGGEARAAPGVVGWGGDPGAVCAGVAGLPGGDAA